MKYVLLTGATGLLGRYLVRDLTALGLPVAVLARSTGRETAADRVAAALAPLGVAVPKVLDGDITAPGLGLSSANRAWVASHCDRVVHSAASLVFHNPDKARDPWLSNFYGTQNVVRLARACGVRVMHHISTAYVCGTRQGPIREEDRNLGQEFRNDYEESKCATEDWLHAEGGFESLTVYRPAVIVGDSHTGYTSTYHGPYRFIQFAALLAQQIDTDDDGKRHIPIRLAMGGDELLNLVPVDWVSAVIARGVAEPAKWGATYHLAPPSPTTYDDLIGALIAAFAMKGVTLVGRDGIPADERNELESAFADYVVAHSEYLGSEPRFDTENTRRAFWNLPCPPVGRAQLATLIDFAVRDQFGKRRRRAGERAA